MTLLFKKAFYILKLMLQTELKSLSPIVLKPPLPSPDITSHENPAIVMTCSAHTQTRQEKEALAHPPD